MMSNGLLCYLVCVKNLHHDIPSIGSVLAIYEFQDVFPDDLPRVPPPREIDFGIDIEFDTKQILIPPYRWIQLNSKS